MSTKDPSMTTVLLNAGTTESTLRGDVEQPVQDMGQDPKGRGWGGEIEMSGVKEWICIVFGPLSHMLLVSRSGMTKLLDEY